MIRKLLIIIFGAVCLFNPISQSYAWFGGNSYSSQNNNRGDSILFNDYKNQNGITSPSMNNQSFWSKTWDTVKSFVYRSLVQPVCDWFDTTFRGAKFVSELKVPEMGFLEGTIKLNKDGSINSIREGTVLTLDKDNMPFKAADGELYRSGKFDYSTKDKIFIPQKSAVKATESESKLASFIQDAKQSNSADWEQLLRTDYSDLSDKSENLKVIQLQDLANNGESMQVIGALYHKLQNEDMVLYAATKDGSIHRVQHKEEYMNDLGQAKKVNTLNWNTFDPKTKQVKQAKTLNFESYKSLEKNETYLTSRPKETYNHQIRLSASKDELKSPQDLINRSTYDEGLNFKKLDLRNSEGFKDFVLDTFANVARASIKDKFDGFKSATANFAKGTIVAETVGKVVDSVKVLEGISKEIVSSTASFAMNEALASPGTPILLDVEKVTLQAIDTEFKADFKDSNFEIKNFEVKYDKLTQGDVNQLVLDRKQAKVTNEIAETTVNYLATAGVSALASPAAGAIANKAISYTQRAISTANRTQLYDSTQTRIIGQFTIGLADNKDKSFHVNFSGRLGVYKDTSDKLNYGIVQMSYEKIGNVYIRTKAGQIKLLASAKVTTNLTHDGEGIIYEEINSDY